MVGMQDHLCRIIRGRGFLGEGAAFVAVADILDREKGLTRLPLFPRPAILPGILVVAAPDVVVGFPTVADEVTGILQLVGIVGDPVVGNRVSTAHWLGPN